MKNKKHISNTLLLLYLLLATSLFGQTLMKDGIETEWGQGEITLHEGTNLRGLVKYNEVNRLIYFKKDTDSNESKTFKETKVLKLSFYDQSKGMKRIFYSFPYQNEGKEEILIFEILREFKDWAVLARKNAVRALEGKNDSGYNNEGLPIGKNTRTVLSQSDGIYAIDQNGKIELFHTTYHREVDGLLMDYSDDNSKIELNILEQYMNPHFDEVEAFAKKSKLKFKKKNDLLQLLDYYATLISDK